MGSSSTIVTALVLLVVLFLVNQRKKDRVHRSVARFKRTFHPKGQEAGFVDVTLSISERSLNDGVHWFTLSAWHDRLLVGLKLGLPMEIPPGLKEGGELDTQNGFMPNAVRLRSIGGPSDRLINSLAALYGVDLPVKRFTARELDLTAFSLNAGKLTLSEPTIGRLKVFFESEDGTYAELYLNFDTTNALIELSEKDPEYREPLLRILSS